MKQITIDGNTACAKMSYKLNEVTAIYPITPSSTMAEVCDEMYSSGQKNIFDQTLTIKEMQSEAGVSGAVHGSLCAGALTTTFTSSQGLLLMIPNMYKIAGEVLPCVFNVSARAIASHALSIFGDHSDIYSCLNTGFNIICSSSVQECLDMTLACNIASICSSLPIIHFFDGFRTSHEIQKIYDISDEEIKKIFPYTYLEKFKKRAMSPTNPYQKGTAQNPDVFFQNREAINSLYNDSFNHILNAFKDIESITKRSYSPFEYYGDVNAEKLIVVMGSSIQTIKEVVDDLNKSNEKIGVVNVRVFRPWNENAFISSFPNTVKSICVLDKAKQSNQPHEQLCQDVISSVYNCNKEIKVIGGRYGLGGKEFTPKDVYSVICNMNLKNPKNPFTVGINDDVTNLSLPPKNYNLNDNSYELKFYGLGSDGTVSANKNSIKIIGESTENFVQGYFEYDSKKSGSMTISHLRISPSPINKPYNVESPDFIGIHNYSFIARYPNLLDGIKKNSILLINTKLNEQELCVQLPEDFKNKILASNVSLYIIDAEKIAEYVGLGNKINTIMQTAFFKLFKMVDYKITKELLINAIKKTYSRKGENVVESNINALKLSEEEISKVNTSLFKTNKIIIKTKPSENMFYEKIIKPIELRKGNDLPVSVFSVDGTIPTNTSKYLKRGIAQNIPNWIKENCIQCGNCTLACPHSAIRSIVTNENSINNAPTSFETVNAIGVKNCKYRIQISPKDCTGCGVCASVCPALKKALEMECSNKFLDKEQVNYEYGLSLKQEKTIFPDNTAKGLQFNKSYFEFNFACAGCGETPYITLLSRLFGEKMLIANATGCSSIYSGSYPTSPFSKNENGWGPSWANSLFEDNAEFGLGMNLAEQTKRETLKNLCEKYLQEQKNDDLSNIFKNWLTTYDITPDEYNKLKTLISKSKSSICKQISYNIDSFVNKSIWIIGGDGWAYDIGYGGLDHVLSSNNNVNILVLDTEIYSNTGGQSSKSSPKGVFAKFATDGKRTSKKDLCNIAIANNNCYVASISLGANVNHAIKCLKEAKEFNGPSLIVAYSPCVNHGFNMSKSNRHMKLAVECGYWNLFRYNPQTKILNIDSEEPTKDYMEFLSQETRFTALLKQNPKDAQILFEQSKQDAQNRRNFLLKLFDDCK